jgi:hypothetical protein
VSKLNPSGSALIYSTYLGGTDLDGANGIAIDSSGDAYVVGSTYSTNFPTVNALYSTNSTNNWAAFLSKLNPSGSALLFSTYLGVHGWTYGNAIAVDSVGSSYITGQTSDYDFPTVNAPQSSIAPGTAPDAFISKIDYSGNILTYSTFLGGNGQDAGTGITVDPNFQPYVTGSTTSTNLPLTATIGSPGTNGVHVWVAKLISGGTDVEYLTEIGGSGGDVSNGIAVMPTCNGAPQVCYDTYVTGYTSSTNFPTVNPIQATCSACGSNAGANSAFVMQLNSAAKTLIYSTFLGGSVSDMGVGITLDSSLNAYVTGWTESPDFPTVNPLQATCSSCNKGSSDSEGYNDAFVTEVNAAGSAWVYSTYLGGNNGDAGAGIAVDSSGNTYVTGMTNSTNFPTYNPIQATNTGSAVFVTMISPGNGTPAGTPSPTSLTFNPQNVGSPTSPQAVTVTNTGNVVLTISTVTLGGTNPGDFPLSNDHCSGTSIAISSTCTINVQFDPLGAGNRSATLNFPDNASNSPLSVPLSGSGIGPGVSFSGPLTFSPQLVNTTSSPQSVTVTNTGSVNLMLSSIGVPAPFTLANSGTCSTSNPIAAGASCTVAITFTPTTAGPVSNSLSLSDNAGGSPQTVTLSGTGQDFSFAAPSGSSTSATVAPGSSATYSLSVGGAGGMSGTVNFTCTGAPSEATCTVPNQVTVGNSATPVTVTVTTTAASLGAPRFPPLRPLLPRAPGFPGWCTLALVLLAIAWIVRRRTRPGISPWRAAFLPFVAGLLLVLALAGCGGSGGGGGGGGNSSNPGTPAGNYTLTVTGTVGSGSSALSHSVNLTLTVS